MGGMNVAGVVRVAKPSMGNRWRQDVTETRKGFGVEHDGIPWAVTCSGSLLAPCEPWLLHDLNISYYLLPSLALFHLVPQVGEVR